MSLSRSGSRPSAPDGRRGRRTSRVPSTVQRLPRNVVEGHAEPGPPGGRSGRAAGRTNAQMRSWRLRTGDGGPQMSNVTRSSQSGAKKRSPSRWSRCRCVRRRWSSPRAALEEVEAEAPDPGAGVEHEDGPVVERDLDARRVPAVPKRVRPRCRHRAAAAPDRQAHGDLTLSRQKIATIPTSSSACANSGNAVTATSRSTPSTLVIRNRSCAARRSSSAIPMASAPSGSGSESSVRGREPRRPFLQRHLTDLRERPAEDRLGRLVVEDEPASLVGDQRRRREIRRELAGENEHEVLRARLAHRPSVRLPRLASGETPIGLP